MAHYKRWMKYGSPSRGSTPWGAAQRFIETAMAHEDQYACLKWPFATNPGGAAQIRRNQHTFLVTRIICERVHGAPPTAKHQAAHSCGKGHESCVNPHHLSWKTQTENEADKVLHGTSWGSKRHPWAKLTEEQVRDIRRRRKSGEAPIDLAREFNINRAYVYVLCLRKTWSRI